ncbi:MAG: hypothetical protein GC202_13235 [Alphaproteobacteria bacterium]|nr:hypothetical protein [Alphaproteobacteria bacterium]
MFCTTPIEALGPEARETLFRVAMPYLEQARITAAELAFDPREHRKLLNSGTKFQEYIQRVAILQGQQLKNPVTERVRQTLELVDGAMRLVEMEAKGLPDAHVADATALDRLAASDAQLGPVRAGIALAAVMAPMGPGTWVIRGQRCLELLSAARHPAVVALLDQTIAELLRIKSACAGLVAPAENLTALVKACLALAGDAESVRGASNFVHGLTAATKNHDMPFTGRAVVEILNGAVTGPASLDKRDPTQELKATRDLRRKIDGLPLLDADRELKENLSRRLTRLTAPESLEPIVAREVGIGRKLLVLLGLHADIEDPNARRYLVAMIDSLVENPEFKSDFYVPGMAHDEKRALAGQVSQLMAASQLSDNRRQRFREIAATAFADLTAAGERRISPRMVAGPEDRVLLGGQRVPLRNWSETGLLFGPFNGIAQPGQHMKATVMLRNGYLSMGFEAELEIVRANDGLIGAKYACNDPHVRQRIKAHFRA